MFPRASILGLLCVAAAEAAYDANWASLDSRPLPSWYDEAKVGIFLHWGVYSVPSFGSEWFWANWRTGGSNNEYVDYIEKNYPPGFSYQEFAKDFTAEFFNPADWADLFVKSGAKYVVLTSKHHEGYTLWPSKYSYSWNSQDVGPHRDLVGDLGEAVRAANLTFGVYHSLLEWYNPMYLEAKENYDARSFVDNKVLPELYELINNYEPAILWSDGDWEVPDFYWNSTEFLAWLYNESPVKDYVVTNDRWGSGIPCNHGGFFTCNDRYNPGTLQEHKWENAMTIDRVSWGYRRNAKLAEYLTTEELLSELASTVSCNGNLLINVGPTKDGLIHPIFEERLLQLGDWLAINGEAIYSSRPWTAQQDSANENVWYTTKDGAVYAIVLGWPVGNKVALGSVSELLSDAGVVTLLGNDGELEWAVDDGVVRVSLPDRAVVRSERAWVLKIIA
ncbi:alpha-L-fucosidase-like [Cylas formicarius]|uniref:alpha-L-fucosidase-like n=1 Tax=Cylas formicarius TaxID=197179 RepID=UPI002958713F|nr:alpha-L-fucosidase-like [Cylas formicarius]